MAKETSITRRGLLKGALATATAPYFLRSTALGAEGRDPASERIAVGQIGVGHQGAGYGARVVAAGEGGGLLGGFMGNPSVQMVAVCDVNASHRDAAKARIEQQYKGVAAYNDFRDLLARDDIDAVVIAVPDHWHAVISIEAAKAGKDIYCEKPLSLTIREARAMVNAVRRYGRVFQTGSMQRSMGQFRYACELVRNGRIGKLTRINIGLPNNGKSSWEQWLPTEPVPEGFDFDTWLGPAPWKPFNTERVSGNYGGGWRYIRDYSGGMMTDWGAHHFDIAQWGLGMDDSGPAEIVPPNGKEVKVLTYHYANGAALTRDPERLARESGQDNGVMFIGTKGKVAVWRYDLKTWPENLKQQRIGPGGIRLYRGDNHHTDFVNAVRTRGRPNAPITSASRSITVCHLGNIAYELGRPVRWDPAREQFVNDSEATRLYSRRMRSPWHL